MNFDATAITVVAMLIVWVPRKKISYQSNKKEVEILSMDVMKPNCYHPLPNCECRESDCMTTSYQYSNVAVPVEITPTAIVGEIKTECCGEPTVLCKENKCKNSCEIVIKQKIRVEIPIIYKVKTCVGESKTDCKCDKPYCEK